MSYLRLYVTFMPFHFMYRSTVDIYNQQWRYDTAYTSERFAWFVFGRCRIQISAGAPNIWTGVPCDFAQSFQANANRVYHCNGLIMS
jgi:hypothetical protein